jgi:hypothetical protein
MEGWKDGKDGRMEEGWKLGRMGSFLLRIASALLSCYRGRGRFEIPSEHLQPAARVQFQAQHSNTPLLRVARFEDEENDVTREFAGAVMPIGFRREPGIRFVHYRHAIDPLLSREARYPAR